MQRTLLLLCSLLLLTGCASPGLPAPEPVHQPPVDQGAGAVEPAPAPPPVTAERAGGSLLPPADRFIFYQGRHAGPVEEFYVRDGDRLIGGPIGGESAVTWFITEQGVWRADPKGGGLLRYLPPTLRENLAWKQQSGADEVWFHLQERSDCAALYGIQSECWQLTVLNRLEREIALFAAGEGAVHRWTENLARPEQSDTLYRDVREPSARPPREQVLARGARLPEGPLPAVTEVSPAEFGQAVTAMLRQAGRPVVEVDLDGDGRPERIEGRLGEWHRESLYLFRADGRLVPEWLMANEGPDLRHHRLELVSIPGIQRPTLLYQYGDPDSWRRVSPRWLTSDGLIGAYGWHPKLMDAVGASLRLEADGTLVLGGVPAELAGYSWTRQYRLAPTGDERRPYQAELVGEEAAPGGYPSDPADLLTAALMARWFGLEEMVGQYIPDPAVRAAFLKTEISRSPYIPRPAEVGSLTWRQEQGWQKAAPEITPSMPAADGSADFLLRVGQWEGFHYYAGRIRFVSGPDGRSTISGFELTHTDFLF